MRINNNLMAMNAYRQLGITNTNSAKTLEKLSSGLRITRAGDDAAGLAISEKMRGQIKGLNMASKNAQDGISLVQNAEGALNETHAILQRMRELAVQSSNDTNTETDRIELQKELDQLSQEISRIGNDTEFNTQKLLNGNFKASFQIGANSGQGLGIEVNDMRSLALGVAGDVNYEQSASVTTAGSAPDLADGTYTVSGTQLKDVNDNIVATTTDNLTWTAKLGEGDDTFEFTQKVDSGTITISEGGKKATGTAGFTNAGLQAGVYTINSTDKVIKDANNEIIANSTDGTTFTLLDGKTEALTLDAAAAENMEITVGGPDISSRTAADKSITTINNAIEKVSAERSKLGAYQNRLEHTVRNLDTSAENLQASESRIRDVDMAKEMMEFTKNNILQQAATAMLAQANQAPQSVLQLLR